MFIQHYIHLINFVNSNVNKNYSGIKILICETYSVLNNNYWNLNTSVPNGAIA
jgi:hypothetical protein